jgi:hypothetical protein
MIECIFTLDYEIFGSGKGSLTEHILAPAERLRKLFRAAGQRFVLFPEVAELESIATASADPGVGSVAEQVRSFHEQGFEVGLHFHPWWYNARREGGEWILDHSEYNLCALPPARIATLIDRGLRFLRGLVGDPGFTPLSYRAGHLLLQPATHVVDVLASRGIVVDSSVYKGGMWRQHGLDYRPALKNGYFWRFETDPNVIAPDGRMLEVPIYTEMVPTWRMLTGKRVGLERRSAAVSRSARRVMDRLRDVRLYRAAKFDYCVLSFDEMKAMIDVVRREDEGDPAALRPLVAIGHTKDLVDLDTVERVLGYLEQLHIPVKGFGGVCTVCGLGSPVEGLDA